MGYITTPLFNILRTSGYDITKPSGIYSAAMATVFDTTGCLDAIKEQHRERLVTGFGLHYFRDEIGQETVPLFKMSVNEKLYNNAEELNQLFDNLDKQIYKRYAVHRAERQDQTAEQSQGKEENQTVEVTAGNSHDINHDIASGSASHADQRQNQSKSKSQDANSNYSAEQASDNGKQGGGYVDSHSNGSNTQSQGETDSNSVTANLDTPQGSINALRTAVGGTPASLKGAGVDAEITAPYRYLTSAASSDGTSVNRDASQTQEQGQSQHEQNLTSENNSNRQSQGGSAGQSEQNIAMQEQGSGSEQTRQESDGTRSSQHADSRQGSDAKQRNDSRTGISQGQDNALDYEITNDMLNEYIPIMSRVWKIFDPCFCILLD